ncbi:hypothetical protein KPH14_010692 [Odynerus spinipes]|uniref:Uncharacterized protein n=1 Tax=Odynerus spinipes TaxID=1348599 RepID=A0AAD9RUW8_9HYME|nr:hypothetical protein KPH14_010692 [Odynerus spinipes]
MKGLQIVTSVLLLAALCKAGSEEEHMKKLEQISTECADEQGLTKDQVEDSPRMICAGEELDKKMTCHMACFYKKVDVMQNGEVLMDKVKESLMPYTKDDKMKEELEEKLNGCKDKIAELSDECDKAAELSKCLLADSKMCKDLPPK